MEGSSIDNLLVVSINGLKGVSINTPLSQDQQAIAEVLDLAIDSLKIRKLIDYSYCLSYIISIICLISIS